MHNIKVSQLCYYMCMYNIQTFVLRPSKVFYIYTEFTGMTIYSMANFYFVAWNLGLGFHKFKIYSLFKYFSQIHENGFFKKNFFEITVVVIDNFDY